MLPTPGEALVARLAGSATRGGDLPADEIMVWLRGRAPGEPMETERELSPARAAEMTQPRRSPRKPQGENS